MPTPGVDCDFTLSHPSLNGGVARGFFLKQEKAGRRALQASRPRHASVAYTSTGSLAFTDSGPGSRQWTLTVACRSGMVQPRGALDSSTAAQHRAGLLDYYALVGQTITFTDPAGAVYPVRFLSAVERMSTLPEPEWEIDCTFLEVLI